ncbi:hypothetical protein, partial [Prevotella conceptionensis]|uniref:hypothetical protein n=1 Tax=Prevotella conceptionensis TaxID=340486 RepID=UPI0005C78E70
PQKDKRIVGEDIIGHWRAVDNDYRTATYANLFFYRDSTAIFDCISDTVMFLRYKLVKDTLIIIDENKVCTKDPIQTLNSKELVLESLKDSENKQCFIRNETSGEQFDSSFVREFM